MKNFYVILDTHPQASIEEIKKAYRRKAMEFHPDRHSELKRPEMAKKFQEIEEAYRILSNPVSKRQYDFDRARENHSVDVSWFEKAMKAHENQKERPIKDVKINFVLADQGVKTVFDGRELVIPPGSAKQGALLKHEGFLLRLNLTFPEGVRMDGESHLFIDVEISLPMMLVGGQSQFKHWDGRVLVLDWPPNSFEGRTLRMKGVGVEIDGIRQHIHFISKPKMAPLSEYEVEVLKKTFVPQKPIICQPKW